MRNLKYEIYFRALKVKNAVEYMNIYFSNVQNNSENVYINSENINISF